MNLIITLVVLIMVFLFYFYFKNKRLLCNSEMTYEIALKIVQEYGKVLEKTNCLNNKASLLPCSKERIREAINFLILTTTDMNQLNLLKGGLEFLKDFE